MRVILTIDDGPTTRPVLLALPAVLGRDPNCDVVLDRDGVSRRHVAVTWDAQAAKVMVADLGSANGTWLDDVPVTAACWPPGGVLRVGDVRVTLSLSHAAAIVPEAAPPVAATGDDAAAVIEYVRAAMAERSAKANVGGVAEEVEGMVAEAMVALAIESDRQETLRACCLAELLGYGPLQDLLHDATVDEVMVNGTDAIWVERAGRLQRTAARFRDSAALLAVIERMAAPLGRRIDEASPTVDGRLPDGARFHAVVPPIALDGPVLTIRKFRARPLAWRELTTSGCLTEALAAWLQAAIRARRNIVVSGGTGSGKTTLLNVLASAIPPDERIVTIEDAAELRLQQPHVVRLEARPPNLEGRGAVSIRDLVRASLRMRPDRIVVGECRGAEALDMLQAMNTGHDGSMTTVHANSPRDALARIETMALMADVALPHRVVREQVVRAVDVLVQTARTSDGARRVVAVATVAGLEGDVAVLHDVATWGERGLTLHMPASGLCDGDAC